MTSRDGEYWGEPVLVHPLVHGYNGCASPRVLKVGGLYRMWHTDYIPWRNYAGYLESTDGINFTKHQTLRSVESPFGRKHGIWPGSIIFENGRYVMYYSARGHGDWGFVVARCESTDGIQWTNFQKVMGHEDPSSWDYQAYDPFVVPTQDGYVMYYTGGIKTSFGDYKFKCQIGMAFSSDGTTWAGRQLLLGPKNLPLEQVDGVFEPFYFKDTNGKQYLYFSFTAKDLGYIARIELQ